MIMNWQIRWVSCLTNANVYKVPKFDDSCTCLIISPVIAAVLLHSSMVIRFQMRYYSLWYYSRHNFNFVPVEKGYTSHGVRQPNS